MTPFAALTTDRDWPWRDSDLVGLLGLVVVAALLVLLTLWTYAGQRKVGWGKIIGVLLLRLGALAIVVLLLLRPSFANIEETVSPGKLLIVLDSSLSMKINDAPNSSARWDFVHKLFDWPDIKEALARLQKEKQIETIFYQAAEDVGRLEPLAKAEGKRTDIGKWLNALWVRHRNDRNLRGLLVVSDGADNGTSFSVLDEAAKWRELPCSIHTFGAGSEATRSGQSDIAVADVKSDKEAIFLKNTVPIKATIEAPNLQGQYVTLRLFVDGKEVSVKQNVSLPQSRGNVLEAGQFTAEQVGEVKVTVKVDPVPGEVTLLNNEMSTFVNVRKEGISVLWVDRPQRLEATWIIRALSKNPRFSITLDERPRDEPLSKAQAEFFKSDEKAFDVVVIGDVSAKRFSGGDQGFLTRIASHVANKKTGLLMLGGYHTFGNKDWQTPQGKSLSNLLPVDLGGSGQIETPGRALPLPGKEGHQLLRLDAAKGKDLWRDDFLALQGFTKLGTLKPGAVPLLATEDTRETVFVVTSDDGPRAAAFAGDTTHLAWCENETAVRAFERFWPQLVTWLARQEEDNNQVWIKLDKRRVAVGANQKIGFSVGAFGKEGLPVRNARYEVTVHGPAGETHNIATTQKLGEERGAFSQANAVGEYKISVTAVAPAQGAKEMTLGTASARFIGFAEDVENLQPAANHQELIKLAAAGGGSFRIAGKEELLQYLNDLRDRGLGQGWVKREVWPNWRIAPASDAMGDQLEALVGSLALPCLAAFIGCIGLEWFLRRRWGMV